MKPLRRVTLSTDIGWAYAAQMKAVLHRTVAPGVVVDLAHDLPRHEVRESAFVLRSMARGFPAGTVHLVVVDPGVGGERTPVAVETADGSILVGPDNGVLFPLAEELGSPSAYRIERRSLSGAMGRASRTFDGRDLFAPAAARLWAGARPRDLGKAVPLRPLRFPRPSRSRGEARGEVLHVDHFGNLITNLPTGWLPTLAGPVALRLGNGPWRRAVAAPHYEAIGRRGRLAVVGSSFGTLEISIRERSAASAVHAAAGVPVRLRAGPRPPAGRPQERK